MNSLLYEHCGNILQLVLLLAMKNLADLDQQKKSNYHVRGLINDFKKEEEENKTRKKNSITEILFWPLNQ